ncbi:hypothetical protein ABT187_49870, partial [Streptomyces sp. NPDC001817]|uniref:hypothetical protein n=1 Tax=Streptomyces sp. NPDC001817 TaxID=3154398 RepID=UPI00331B8C73
DHTQYTPARTYTPDGYFTTRDTHPTPFNKYQAFDADPINGIDPTGHITFSTVKKYTGQAAIAAVVVVVAVGVHRAMPESGAVVRTVVEGLAGIVASLATSRTTTPPNLSFTGKGNLESSVGRMANVPPPGKSPGRRLFAEIEKNIPGDNSCQAIFWATCKSFSEEGLWEAKGEVYFARPHAEALWGKPVATGSLFEMKEALRNAPPRRLFALGMHSNDGSSHIALAWRGAQKGDGQIPIKRADVGHYGDFSLEFLPPWTRNASEFHLFDTGVDKLPNAKLQEKMIELWTNIEPSSISRQPGEDAY